MLLGLIADTHDHLPHIRKATEIFRSNNVQRVFHAGDYCSPFTIPLFEGFLLNGVLGNNDGDHYLLMKKFDQIGANLLGGFGRFTIEDKEIGLYHGTEEHITDALEQCGIYDVVITGHTHKKKVVQVSDTLAINPGTANGFGEEASVGILDAKTLEVEFISLN
jgi:putative phosphoesterase